MKVIESKAYRDKVRKLAKKKSEKKDDKFERCVRHLKDKQNCDGDDCEYNPFAVCHSTVG